MVRPVRAGGDAATRLGIVIAKAVLQSAITAANEKSHSTPKRIHTQPPSGAAIREIRWLIESPVESVAVISSGFFERSRT